MNGFIEINRQRILLYKAYVKISALTPNIITQLLMQFECGDATSNNDLVFLVLSFSEPGLQMPFGLDDWIER